MNTAPSPWTWGVKFGPPHPELELHVHGARRLTIPLSRAEAEQLLPEISPMPALPEHSGRTLAPVTTTHTYTETENDAAPADDNDKPARRHPSIAALLRNLQEQPALPRAMYRTGREFTLLSQSMANAVHDDPELAAALRKLLEARDCFVRAAATMPSEEPSAFGFYYGLGPHHLTFAEALAELRAGNRVARAGWNGHAKWLVLVPGSTFTVETDRPLGHAAPELIGQSTKYLPHLDLCNRGALGPWTPSTADLFAEDWYVVANAAIV